MLKINQELHNEGHMGRDKTLKLLVDKFHWPSMQKEVEKFVGGAVRFSKCQMVQLLMSSCHEFPIPN